MVIKGTGATTAGSGGTVTFVARRAPQAGKIHVIIRYGAHISRFKTKQTENRDPSSAIPVSRQAKRRNETKGPLGSGDAEKEKDNHLNTKKKATICSTVHVATESTDMNKRHYPVF